MKRSFTILFIVIILMGTFVSALENFSETDKPNISDITRGKLTGATGNLNNQTEDILDRELTLPFLSIFKIDEGKLTIKELTIFTVFMILTFLIFLEVSLFIPFLSKEITDVPFELTLRPFFSLILTLIPAVMGTIYQISQTIPLLLESTTFLEKLGPFQILIWIIVVIILFIIFSWTSKQVHKGEVLGKAEALGKRASLLDERNKIDLETSA